MIWHIEDDFAYRPKGTEVNPTRRTAYCEVKGPWGTEQRIIMPNLLSRIDLREICINCKSVIDERLRLNHKPILITGAHPYLYWSWPELKHSQA